MKDEIYRMDQHIKGVCGIDRSRRGVLMAMFFSFVFVVLKGKCQVVSGLCMRTMTFMREL